MCNCGCNTCKTKSTLLVLNENVAPKEILSEGLKYHIDNDRPLTDHLYRAGSESYFNLIAEARSLYSRGIIDVVGVSSSATSSTDLMVASAVSENSLPTTTSVGSGILTFFISSWAAGITSSELHPAAMMFISGDGVLTRWF